ncbi:DMB protein, partial [Pterocles burchelli]|nr:DMB protein [Pterocles burchelli]
MGSNPLGPRPPLWTPLVGAFLVHVASSCMLVANGSGLVANGSLLGFELAVVFNKNPLVCYDPKERRFVPCDGGILRDVAVRVAQVLNANGSHWLARAESRQRACQELATEFWMETGLRRTPPRVRIVPVPLSNVPNSVLLTCHVWGFYPPEVTVLWLRNGDIAQPGHHPTVTAVPNGDWTYQARVTLQVTPVAGDTFTCWVQHPSLDRPLLQDW